MQSEALFLNTTGELKLLSTQLHYVRRQSLLAKAQNPIEPAASECAFGPVEQFRRSSRNSWFNEEPFRSVMPMNETVTSLLSSSELEARANGLEPLLIERGAFSEPVKCSLPSLVIASIDCPNRPD